MKRALSVLISLILILCTFFCFGSVTAESDNYFETLSNWIMGDQTNTGIVDNSGYAANRELVTGTSVPNENSATAIKFYRNGPLRGSVKLEGLTANTDYRLTVSFYSDGYSTSNNCIIREAGIFTSDAEGANLRWQTGGYKGYLNVMTYNVTQRAIPDAVSYSSAIAVDSALNTTVTNYPTGKWNSLVFTFNTGNFKNIYFTLLAETNCTVYLDDIVLEKCDYFEDTSKWIMGDQTNTEIANNTSYSTAKTPVGGAEVPDKNSSFASKFYRSSGPLRGSMKLENLEANTDYRFTVSFYSDDYSTDKNCIIREAGIFTPDVTDANLKWQSGTSWTGYLNVMTYNTNQIYMSEATYSPRTYMDSEKNLTVTNHPVGEWNTVTFTFNSGSFENIYFTALFETDCTVYLDDISLEKVDYYNSFSNWVMGDHTSTGITEIGKYDSLRANVNGKNVSADTDNSVLKFYRQAGPLRASLKLNGLMADTDYTVSVSVYSNDYSESNNCTLRQAGIFTSDVTDANLIWQSGTGWTGYLNIMAYNTAQISMPTASNSNQLASDSNKSTSVNNYPVGKWNTFNFTFNSGDFENIYFTTLIETNCTVYLKDITVTPKYTGATAYNSAAALRVAGFTDSGNVKKNGMRIYNSISTEFITSANVVEYGLLAMLKGDAANLNIETARAKGVAFSKGTSYSEAKDAVLWEVKEAIRINVFTSYLTGISQNYYDDYFVIRAYAIIEDADGNEAFLYGDEVELCIFDVANAIDNGNLSGGAVRSEKDVEAFKYFVTNLSTTDELYISWCSENGKAIGDLYEKYHSAE